MDVQAPLRRSGEVDVKNLAIAASAALISGACSDARKAAPRPSPTADASVPTDAFQRVDAALPLSIGRAERISALFRRDCPPTLPPSKYARPMPVPGLRLGDGVRYCHTKGPGVDGVRFLAVGIINQRGESDDNTKDYDYTGGFVMRLTFEYEWRQGTSRPAACDGLPDEALAYYQALSGINDEQVARLAATFRSVDSTENRAAYRIAGLDQSLYVSTYAGREIERRGPRCTLSIEAGDHLPTKQPVVEINLLPAKRAVLDGGTDAR